MPTIRPGQFVLPAPPSSLGGDSTVVKVLDNGTFAAIVDVLGHGAEAKGLTRGIDAYLNQHAAEDVVNVMRGLHERLRGTRGAGLCYVEEPTGRLRYAGIGNTVVRRLGRGEDRLVSRDGVLGQTIPRTPLEQDLQLAARDVVLLYTDGVQSHFEASELKSLSLNDPAALARAVVERFGKRHDDAGCVALRYEA